MALGSGGGMGGGGADGDEPVAAASVERLDAALAGYCAAEGTDEEAVTHLNAALIQMQKSKRFEELVAKMGPYLTTEDERVRTKAAMLLGEVLSRLSGLSLTGPAVHHYVNFFSSRLSDFPSVGGSLLALRSLLQHHAQHARKEARLIVETIFKDVHVPSLAQGLRQKAFEVLFEVLSPSDPNLRAEPLPPALNNMQGEFIRGFLDCMEGEKDPRCLILCLNSLSRAQATMPSAMDEYAEGVLDVTACYFPITFTPPPNDPYGITPQMLSTALQNVLTGRPTMAEYVLPLLVDKLSSTHVPAKLEALATLQVAARRYGGVALRRNLSIVNAVFQEVVSCPEENVVSAALDTARVLVAQLSSPVKDGGASDSGDWDVMCKGFISKSVEEFQRSPNSLMARACARLLGSVARASSRAYSAVLNAACPVGLKLLQSNGGDSKAADEEHHGSVKQSALELVVDLVDAADALVDFSATREGPPLAPYAVSLRDTLLACLKPPVHAHDAMDDDSRSSSKHCEWCDHTVISIRGLCSLATRSPSALLPQHDVAQLVSMLSSMLRTEPLPDHEVSHAILNGLQAITKRRPEYTAVVLENTLPELLTWLDQAQGAALERCLTALAELATEMDIFRAVVPALLDRALDRSSRTPYPLLKHGQGTVRILSALAKIFAATTTAQRDALCVMLALGDGGSNGVHVGKEGARAAEQGSLWLLIVALLASSAGLGEKERASSPLLVGDDASDDTALEAGKGILASVTELVCGDAQDRLASRLLQYFFPPSVTVEGSSNHVSGPPLPGFEPVSSKVYLKQSRAVAILNAALAALEVTSPLFQSPAVVNYLLPSLVRLALLNDGGSTLLPACQGAAVLVNKLPVDGAVESAVEAWLKGLRSAGAVVDPEMRLEEAKAHVTGLAWLTKALSMRGTPRVPLTQALGLLVDVIEMKGAPPTPAPPPSSPPSEPSYLPPQMPPPDPTRLALALHAAGQMGTVFGEDAGGHRYGGGRSWEVRAPPLLGWSSGTGNKARVNPLWRQRLFYMAFPRLKAEVERRGQQQQAQAPALLAMCHMVPQLPKAVLESELDSLMIVVIQAMSSRNAELSARAVETFACMTKESVDAAVPHLSTLIPLLLNLVTAGSDVFLERARLRVLALESLLKLSRLPYAKVHPHRAQVTRGLLGPLDDKKRAVRSAAVKARNEWMVVASERMTRGDG